MYPLFLPTSINYFVVWCLSCSSRLYSLSLLCICSVYEFVQWYIFGTVVTVLVSSEGLWSGGGKFCQFLAFLEKLISPSFTDDRFDGYTNLDMPFFKKKNQSFNISFHSLLACRNAVEKSAASLMGFQLLVTLFLHWF